MRLEVRLLAVAGLLLVCIELFASLRRVAPDALVIPSLPFAASTTTSQQQAQVAPTQADAFGKELFEQHESCTYIENVCHSAGSWWYDEKDAQARQPDVSIMTSPPKRTVAAANYRLLDIHHSEHLLQQSSNMTCSYSPIPNHFAVFSQFNHMLGEFYNKGLTPLFQLLRVMPEDFFQQTQFYLHQHRGDRDIMDSHRLFMEPVLRHPLLDFKELLYNTGCRCMQRVVFCGYKEYVDKRNITRIETQKGLKRAPGYEGNRRQDPRYFLIQTVVHDNPLVQEQIQQFRKSWLRKKGVYSDYDEYKLVGLAQRAGRRRWLNLPEIQQQCDERFLKTHKVACIETNVEVEESNPLYQAVMHASLDGLIGIHGAQLTEAVWTRPGALFMEMLPWIPAGRSVGQWTRWVHRPTALGQYFTDTDINHIGLVLERESAPYCQWINSTWANFTEAEVECFGWEGNDWADRNFLAPEAKVLDAIDKFVVNPHEDCEDLKAIGKEDFVLYNVNCAAVDDGELSPRHYYWPKGMNKKET